MELTLRNIPSDLGKALHAKARAEGKSIDEVAVEALAVAISTPSTKKRDLSDIAGTWVEDPVFDEIRREHERIDPDLWK